MTVETFSGIQARVSEMTETYPGIQAEASRIHESSAGFSVEVSQIKEGTTEIRLSFRKFKRVGDTHLRPLSLFLLTSTCRAHLP